MSELSSYNLTTEELPEWMRPKKRRFDRAFLLVFTLSLILMAPLIVNQGIPATPTAHAEMFRIQTMADNFTEGQVYPRWAWQFNQNTGSPIFNYVAPAPHAMGGLYQALTRSSSPATLRYFIIFWTVWGTLSTLFFVRQRWTDEVGLLAALLYITSPLVLTIAPYWQVDIGIILATALLPFNLWVLDRIVVDGAGFDFILLGLGMAGLLLAENGLGIVLTGFVLLWLMYLILVEHKRQNIRLTLGGMMLAGVISLIFYVPAINQLREVGWQTTQPDWVAETRQFYALPWQATTDSHGLTPLYLGLVSTLGGFLACGWWMGRSVYEKRRFPAIYMLLVIFVGLAIMMRSQAGILWSPFYEIEPLSVHDLFGLFNFCAVILTALTLNDIRLSFPQFRHQWLGGGLVALFMFINLTYIDLPTFTDEKNIDLATYTRWENETGWFSTLPNGYLTTPHSPLSPKLAEFETNHSENILLDVKQTAHSRELYVYTPLNNRLFIHTYNYPGLRLRLNDRTANLNIDSETNQLYATVPQGNTRFVIEFTYTPLYLWSLGVSLLALVMLILIGYGLETSETGK